MAVITQTIGTSSRDYSTLQSWEDALPANFVTDGNSYVGACYNDSEFTGAVSISAHTTDATHTLTLTAAAGQSFQDHADVRTHALRYNQANGVGLIKTTDYTTGIRVDGVVDYLTVSRLQIKMTNATAAPCMAIGPLGDCLHVSAKDLICESAMGGLCVASSAAVTAVNVLFICTGSGGNGFDCWGAAHINCAAIRLTDNGAAGIGFRAREYASNIKLVNCASFGFSSATGTYGSPPGTFSAASSNNATEQSSGFPGSNNQYNVTYSSSTPFTDAAGADYDMRAVAATALAGNGAKDATNAPNDISGTVRATACTIGVWELSAAASAFLGHIAQCRFIPSFLGG